MQHVFPVRKHSVNAQRHSGNLKEHGLCRNKWVHLRPWTSRHVKASWINSNRLNKKMVKQKRLLQRRSASISALRWCGGKTGVGLAKTKSLTFYWLWHPSRLKQASITGEVLLSGCARPFGPCVAGRPGPDEVPTYPCCFLWSTESFQHSAGTPQMSPLSVLYWYPFVAAQWKLGNSSVSHLLCFLVCVSNNTPDWLQRLCCKTHTLLCITSLMKNAIICSVTLTLK